MPLGIQIPTRTISLNAKTTLTSILVSRYVISWIKLKGRGTWTICLTFITVARFHCQPPCMILYNKAACWKCIATPPFEECIRDRERAKGLHDAHLSLSLPLGVSYFAWVYQVQNATHAPSLNSKTFLFCCRGEVRRRQGKWSKRKKEYLKCIGNEGTERCYFHNHKGKSAGETFIAFFCWLPHSPPLSCNR